MQTPSREAVIKRLWLKVRKTDGCWEWTGATRQGYGIMKFMQSDGSFRRVMVHRIVWWLEHGEWPPLIRHKCDNPPCVRIDHLETGTHGDNSRDREERGRTSRGTTHPGTKLTEETVAEARRLRRAGMPWSGLAIRFGVCAGTIVQACIGTSWRHVTEPIAPQNPAKPAWHKAES